MHYRHTLSAVVTAALPGCATIDHAPRYRAAIRLSVSALEKA